jgi:hypothetical protein
MENTHEFKAVHDPLFCKEGGVPYDLNIEKGTGYESTESKFYNPGNIPACDPHNDCSVIQDFIGEEDGSYDEYLRIKRDALREIVFRENKIQELLLEMKEHISSIKDNKKEIDEAFTKYISIQWQ